MSVSKNERIAFLFRKLADELVTPEEDRIDELEATVRTYEKSLTVLAKQLGDLSEYLFDCGEEIPQGQSVVDVAIARLRLLESRLKAHEAT